MDEIKGQIFLGGDEFVKRMQARLGEGAEDVNVPRAQWRLPAPPLAVIKSRFRHRDEAIVTAYATGVTVISRSRITLAFTLQPLVGLSGRQSAGYERYRYRYRGAML